MSFVFVNQCVCLRSFLWSWRLRMQTCAFLRAGLEFRHSIVIEPPYGDTAAPLSFEIRVLDKLFWKSALRSANNIVGTAEAMG